MDRKILVFLDIDGTLLTPDYKTNSDDLPKVIETLAKRGFLFGINSNRSYEDIIPIVRQFNLNGPIIVENGIYYVMPPYDLGSVTMIVQAEDIKEKLRNELEPLAARDGAYLKWSDTVNMDRTGLAKYPLAWVANIFRKYTASIHVRSFGEKNPELARELADLIVKEGNFADYHVKATSVFSNVLIFPKSTDKGVAISMLKKIFFQDSTIVLIGDDLADMPGAQIADFMFAPSNADSELKDVADFVSDYSYTQGVIDILNRVDGILDLE
ncbi:MAG: HAD family hydrolase [Candidatus Uhrbacteria bacterium]|nr:HAD family hydrolase [Candidatus Uhrbacteria bacterium]